MKLNQNETGGKIRNPNAECRIDRSSFVIRHSSFPRAFTLTELLVVITIIAVLAGLITGAAVNALNKAKQASITLEIQQLSSAIEDSKNEYGAYPPNGMIQITTPANILAQNDFVRMFRKSFPRGQEPLELIRALAGAPLTASGQSSELTDTGMNAAEAMVFWLGGFSSDPQYPISGPGGPSFNRTIVNGEVLEDRNRRYEFDLGRLGPRNAGGTFDDSALAGRFIAYSVDLNRDGDVTDVGESRRINFWQYAPNGSEQPFVYLDVSRHKPEAYDMPALGPMGSGKPMVHAIEKVREGFSGTLGHNDLVFVNQGKFQILHAGLDDAWGDFMQLSLFMQNDIEANVITFPTGPFIGDIADTVGNFGVGTLEDAQP